MVDAANAVAAPELATDDKLDRGFVSWFKGLKEVRLATGEHANS